MSRYEEYEGLVAVVDAGSFTAAAERLGIAKSMVSRRVSQLEQRLGSQLLRRTTRSLTLTDTGKVLYQRAVQFLADIDDAELSISDDVQGARGLIRMAAPLSFGLTHLSSVLAEFMRLHPAIELQLDLNDRQVNLVEEGFDLAVRIGDLQDSSLIARRLATIRGIACASDAYVQERGEPLHPAELQQHVGLQYSNVSYRQQWTFLDAAGEQVIAQPQIRIRANNGEALARASAAGLGITVAPTFILASFISEGVLRPILRDFSIPKKGMYALYPPGRLVSNRVRMLSDFLAERFGEQPYWDDFSSPG